MILDSNLIIYATQPAYPGLNRLIARLAPSVSAISRVEVLGYQKITVVEIAKFQAFFAATRVLPVTDAIIEKAIEVRQVRKIELGDALIAATAIVAGEELYTHNTKDFTHIPGLTVIDPIAAGDPP